MNKQGFLYTKNKIWVFLSVSGLLFLGVLIGVALSYFLGINHSKSYSILREGGYEYINPLIDFDNIDFVKTKEQRELEKKIVAFIEDVTKTNPNVAHISTYYKDLNTGGWIGVDEEERFALASLGKVPVMIAHYKLAEANPQHLKKGFIYDFDPEVYEDYIEDNRTDEGSLEEGTSYTLDEYINQLIIHSDNTVLPFLVAETAFLKERDAIFSSLGVTNPYYSYEDNFITAKDYATFFRILYNATYLNKEMSSKALELLSKVSYDEGLAKGLPEDIVLANKFGERTFEPTDGEVIEQLHDCGIIYHPTRPYILCVMTRGSDPSELQKVISTISSIVYKTVDSTAMNSREIRDLLQRK